MYNFLSLQQHCELFLCLLLAFRYVLMLLVKVLLKDLWFYFAEDQQVISFFQVSIDRRIEDQQRSILI